MDEWITETVSNEVRKYIVSGDYVTREGDVKFDQRQYDAQTPQEATKQAKEDGLVRLTSSFEKK